MCFLDLIDKIIVSSKRWGGVMFLKKLKIDGFKSFAKPIVIDFQSPLAAIVGPNGSGKSNIVDSIRWALGEQSAKSLRGSKMADVIFAGSEGHKPLKKASVTLYLDNSDRRLAIESNEVRICRQVTEDGQSDYLINGSICRLKDIEEIFLDTGMGKDSYSIVGQGKIDSILNSKPEKIRELFEEAAGISKHRMRKDEAEKRLETTKTDLQRIKDLIWELEKQVNPLKRASEKARKYQRLRVELEVLEVSMMLERWESNNQELTEVRKDRNSLEEQTSNVEQETRKYKQFLTVEEKELEELLNKIEELQEKYYQLKTKKEQTSNNLKILAERESSLVREQNNINEQAKILDETNNKLANRLIEIKDELINHENNKGEIISVIHSQEKLLEKNKEKLLKERTALEFLRNSVMDENIELKDLQTELEKARERSRYLESEIDKMIYRRKGISTELDMNLLNQENLTKELNNVINENGSIAGNIRTIEQLITNTENIRSEVEDKVNKMTDDINRKSSRLKVLKELEDDYQGYFKGVKTILKNSSKIEGLIGVVADKFSVKKKYELAVEIALGAKLQNIIVEDDQSARDSIKLLKDTNGGRATFLPLNMINENRLDISKLDIEGMEGYLGLLSDFVSCVEKLNVLKENLLGRIILTDNIDHATEIAKRIKGGQKIVTLDGDFVSPGGSITGGSHDRHRTGLLGRSREIEELKNQLGLFKERLSNKNKEFARLDKKLIELNTEKDEKNKRLNKLGFKLNDLNKDIDNLKKEQSRLENELKEIDKEFENVHHNLGENDNKQQSLQKKIEVYDTEHSREKEEMSGIEEKMNVLAQQGETIKARITELKIRLATLTQKSENFIREEQNLESQINENDQKRNDYLNQLDSLSKKMNDLKNRRRELKTKGVEFEKDADRTQKEYLEYQSKHKEKQSTVENIREKLQHVQEYYGKHKEKIHKLELKITRLEDRNVQIVEKLQEEYDIAPHEGYARRIEIKNNQEINSKIKEFKKAISSLGNINPDAVQEYNTLKERIEFLIDQEEDLLKARDSIIEVIDNIKEKMSNLFYQTFVKVRSEFENIFTDLFSGGKAELKLTCPESLLETGVEIEAQPPGKQLKKLSLMSGGERALTAIALVFAFLKVNPSPMYILDEIDAPLDDANVMRFARFLKEYSNYVQFLLITHNKRMMTQAANIYGVTMEQFGISKLVSLKLEDIA